MFKEALKRKGGDVADVVRPGDNILHMAVYLESEKLIGELLTWTLNTQPARLVEQTNQVAYRCR